jgi:serine/threonine-protein kinase
MIILQVCRALAHAHAGGILHRDVKPENIMVRGDGVVKLMDFGISHMVDLERLTVTGQLLGSPAYMAPEHVEGRQLDFRTDVFAVGIVLYQLTCGRLPFEGKNPHEVLKRIAECKFVDPRQINPQIGNRLGRIILRAMAAEPGDRFPAVSEMVLALEGYLDESGLATDKAAGELARYFQTPAAYEQALETRLVDHLTARGVALLADNQRASALDVFDRVLAIDPDNPKVLAILDRLNRGQRLRQGALAVAAVAVVAGCVYMIHRNNRDIEDVALGPLGLHNVAGPPSGRAAFAAADDDKPPPLPPPGDAAVVTERDASAVVVAPPDIGPVPIPVSSTRIAVSPARGSLVQIGDGEWQPVPDDGIVIAAIEREMLVRVRNKCCQEEAVKVEPGAASVKVDLSLKPGVVIARCGDATVEVVKIDGARTALGQRREIFFEGMSDSRSVAIEFIGKGWDDKRSLQVRSGTTETVTCARP